jgi:DNA-binding IclR family transcriptional regulator
MTGTLTAAELARRLGVDPEAACRYLHDFEQTGLAERVNGGYLPTARGLELGLALVGEAHGRDVPLTIEDVRALRPSSGPARETAAA